MDIGKKVDLRDLDQIVILDTPASKQNQNRNASEPIFKIKNVFVQSEKIQCKEITVKEAIKLQNKIGLVECNQIRSRS